jgi:membrane protease YdiL (CAAX protease family)
MNTRTTRSVWIYFLLVFVLSLPLYLLGAFPAVQILPGIPLSGLSFLCPVIAAAILAHRENGRSGVKDLLKRSFDFGRIKEKIWYLPLILLMPLIMVLSYGVTRAIGTPIPTPQFTVVKTLGLLIGFFFGALCEELGWSGYAIDPLQDRFGAFKAALLIGVVWAVWHFIPLLEARRSLSFIAWWTLGTVAIRITMVWLYNNTGGSVFVAAVYHVMVNLTWQLYPINGSYYDPRVTSPIMAFVAVLAIVVWRSKTLTRTRS